MRALRDAGDRRVDLESFGYRNATIWAEPVHTQTEKGGGNKIEMIRMLLPEHGNKKQESQRW